MKIKLILLLVTTTLIFSCKKDVISQTQSQVSASNLAKALGVEENKTYSGYSILVLNSSNSNVLSNNGSSLMVTSDGFIIITSTSNGTTNSVTYNLGEMKSYQIMNFSSITDLYLYY